MTIPELSSLRLSDATPELRIQGMESNIGDMDQSIPSHPFSLSEALQPECIEPSNPENLEPSESVPKPETSISSYPDTHTPISSSLSAPCSSQRSIDAAPAETGSSGEEPTEATKDQPN